MRPASDPSPTIDDFKICVGDVWLSRGPKNSLDSALKIRLLTNFLIKLLHSRFQLTLSSDLPRTPPSKLEARGSRLGVSPRYATAVEKRRHPDTKFTSS